MNNGRHVTICMTMGLRPDLLAPKKAALIERSASGGVPFARLDPVHHHWFGDTFNPHLARRSVWHKLGGFSQFRHERAISRYFRKQGQFTAYLTPGACRHGGWDASTRKGAVEVV